VAGLLGATRRGECSERLSLAANCLNPSLQHPKLLTMDKPHRKLVKHYHEPGDLHELTFSCYHRLPLLTNDRWRQELARCIDSAGQETDIKLAAFVFMP
jgi:hypothetical protein